jgi:hypothetical protein
MLRISKVDEKYEVVCNDISLHDQVEAVNPIVDMFNNRNKCVLYIKNTNTYIRFMAKFLLKNKSLGGYSGIRMQLLHDMIKDKDVVVSFIINNEIRKRFKVCG